MIASEIRRKYQTLYPRLEYVSVRVSDLVRRFCDRNGFAFVGRIKGLSSVAEKLEGGRLRGWSEINDLHACAIVVPTLEEEASVLEWLRTNFVEESTTMRGATSKAPEVFRFESTRFYGRLKSWTPEEATDATEIMFEVQVRTAFEHAWSATTHRLAYKGGGVDWRRARLAAQLKAVVEQLDLLVAAFDQNVAQIGEGKWQDYEAMTVVQRWLDGSIAVGAIPTEQIPESTRRFCENVVALVSAGKARADGIVAKTESLVEALHAEHQSLGLKCIPASLSVFQYVACVGVAHGVISVSLHRRTLVVTQSMLDLYPAVGGVLPKFDFA